jgi:Ca-activated chloride channel homolog
MGRGSVYLCLGDRARKISRSVPVGGGIPLKRGPSTIERASTLLVGLIAFLSFTPRVGFAQTAEAPLVQHPLEATTELVKLDVTVLNAQGEFVDGLDQSSFRVLDDGVERPIAFFDPVSAPAKVVLILETSPAVYLFADEHIAAADALLTGLGNDDQVALITYADTPKQVVGFTLNKQQLVYAIENVQYMLGTAALNLYDSVSTVVDALGRFPGKKAIVLLTTGLDSSPPAHWDALLEKLRNTDVVIFSVGLGRAFDDRTPKPKPSKKSVSVNSNPAGTDVLQKAQAGLVELSDMTGGRAYFPETAKDFAPAYREISSSLRHEYVLGIAPGHDGRLHHLSVEVLDRKRKSTKSKKRAAPEYSVSARDGYLAPH